MVRVDLSGNSVLLRLSLCEMRNDFGIRERPGVPRFVPRPIEVRSEQIRLKDVRNRILFAKNQQH